jgi:hypothetical protein
MSIFKYCLLFRLMTISFNHRVLSFLSSAGVSVLDKKDGKPYLPDALGKFLDQIISDGKSDELDALKDSVVSAVRDIASKNPEVLLKTIICASSDSDNLFQPLENVLFNKKFNPGLANAQFSINNQRVNDKNAILELAGLKIDGLVNSITDPKKFIDFLEQLKKIKNFSISAADANVLMEFVTDYNLREIEIPYYQNKPIGELITQAQFLIEALTKLKSLGVAGSLTIDHNGEDVFKTINELKELPRRIIYKNFLLNHDSKD